MTILEGQAQKEVYHDIKDFYRGFEVSEGTYIPPVRFLRRDDISQGFF
jgi:hypothetical protein